MRMEIGMWKIGKLEIFRSIRGRESMLANISDLLNIFEMLVKFENSFFLSGVTWQF